MTLTAPQARRVVLPAAIAALVGFVGFAVGLAVEGRAALVGYLDAYAYGLSLALGALCLVMIAHATDARWFVVVRRLAETVAATLPLFALLFLPILFGAQALYPWAHPERLPAEVARTVAATRSYLNLPFFVVRSLVYLAAWSALAVLLRRWSLRQDRSPAEAPLGRALVLAGVGLFVFGFTITFAAFDWLMSLLPSWSSTVFGVYYFAGAMVGALALLLLLSHRMEASGLLADRLAASHYHALGRLLLTFVVFWAYIAYAQGFLIWIADLPREVPWYVERVRGGWSWVLGAVVVGQFAAPFFALLSRPLKRNGAAMGAIGAWLLVMHYLDVAWIVIPGASGPRSPGWVELASLLAVLGSAVAVGAWLLSTRPVVPVGDPRLVQSLEYESL